MSKERFKPDQDDFIIVVLGRTGSGKSNFVNKLTGNAERLSAGNLKSDTQDVIPYPIPYHGLRLVLVDTPGFDDTYRPDSETLRIIADWLIQRYPDGTTLKIAGIVYTHKITDNRMAGSAVKNLHMFSRLCGNIPLPRTRLVTTMWDLVKDPALARQRETELTGDFWQILIRDGATAHQFHNTPASAWDIVQNLLDLGIDRVRLLLQEELVEEQKHLNETETGKVLYSRLQRLLDEQKRGLKQLTEEAEQRNNPVLAKSLQEEHDRVDAQLRKTFEEIKEVKVPFPRRVLLWLYAQVRLAVSLVRGSD